MVWLFSSAISFSMKSHRKGQKSLVFRRTVLVSMHSFMRNVSTFGGVEEKSVTKMSRNFWTMSLSIFRCNMNSFQPSVSCRQRVTCIRLLLSRAARHDELFRNPGTGLCSSYYPNRYWVLSLVSCCVDVVIRMRQLGVKLLFLFRKQSHHLQLFK